MAEAIRFAASIKPDVVVMDVRLADGSGIEATREIRAQRPETKVLMLTSFADDEALFASIMPGSRLCAEADPRRQMRCAWSGAARICSTPPSPPRSSTGLACLAGPAPPRRRGGRRSLDGNRRPGG